MSFNAFLTCGIMLLRDKSIYILYNNRSNYLQQLMGKEKSERCMEVVIARLFNFLLRESVNSAATSLRAFAHFARDNEILFITQSNYSSKNL